MHSALAFSGDADDVAQAGFRLGPPDNEGPSALGARGVIGRSADVAILLVGLTRYTTGLQIELAARCRIDPDLGDRTHSTVDAGLFADGRPTAEAGSYIRNYWRAADRPVLTRGARGGREWSSTLWLTPAAPPGDPVLAIADLASARTSRSSPWMPKHFELRPRRFRPRGRASLIGRARPFSRRSTYRPGAILHGYFRR